jgi:hypothetical protein
MLQKQRVIKATTMIETAVETTQEPEASEVEVAAEIEDKGPEAINVEDTTEGEVSIPEVREDEVNAKPEVKATTLAPELDEVSAETTTESEVESIPEEEEVPFIFWLQIIKTTIRSPFMVTHCHQFLRSVLINSKRPLVNKTPPSLSTSNPKMEPMPHWRRRKVKSRSKLSNQSRITTRPMRFCQLKDQFYIIHDFFSRRTSQ